MKTELIEALSNANINSDSAEVIANEYISYLYFSEVVESISLTVILCSLFILMKCLLGILRAALNNSSN